MCSIVILVITMIENVIKILPIEIGNIINSLENLHRITEIRLRVNRNLKIYLDTQEVELNIKITKENLIRILKNVSANSIYSVQNDINNGFITIEGGNRIGIAGEAVIIENKIKNIKDISSMNIRIAKEIIGISDKILNNILKDKTLQNTIIVSPPCSGKTTLLRDIIRNLSNRGYNISLIDERGEIACMYNGFPTLNIGERTDVISFIPKAQGMQMAVRSMAHQIVCTDEIGNDEDVEAIKYLCRCGVNFIVTMHGNSLKDIHSGKLKEIVEDGYLDNIIILSNTF